MKDKGKYLKYGLHIAVVIGLVWAVVKYVDVREVANALRSFNHIYIPIMIVLSLASFLLKGWRFVIMMSPFADEVSNFVVFKGFVAGQAIALLPAGLAARAGLMKQVGIPVSESSAPVAFQSSWDQAVLLLGGLIAALWFPVARLPIFITLGVLVVAGVLLAIPSVRNWLNDNIKRLAARFDYEEQWERFLEAIPKIFTKKIVGWSIFTSVLAFVLQFIALWLAVEGLKLEIPIPTLFLAFVIPTMLGRLVPVPGGFGVTEAGMVSFLTSTVDVNTDATVAAVALFRIATILVPAALGAVVYFFFWRGEEEVDEDAVKEKEANPAVEQLTV